MLKNQLTLGAATRSASRRTATTSSTGRTTSSRRTTSTPATTKTLGGASTVELRRHRVRSSGPEAVVRHRRLHAPTARRVIAQHRYDLWLRAARRIGADATSPTASAAKNEIRFRYVRIEPRSDRRSGGRARRRFGGGRGGGARARATIDLSKPITLSAYGEWTKKAGFYELAERPAEGARLRGRVVQQPDEGGEGRQVSSSRGRRSSSSPTCASRARASRTRRRSRDANPQQAEYLWGHRVLFDFKDKDGHRLQGILAMPDDYKPGEKRPMLVNFYEKNSQNLHRYNAPSYLTGMGSSPMEAVSEGYITMLPDVYFHTGSSHSDMLECGRSGDAEGDRDGLRRSEAHRHQRPQLRRRRRGVHRHALAAVRGRRHGRRRDRSLLGLQPELGLVVPGHRRQRRERQRLLPVRPGPLGLLAVGQARDLHVRVGADARAAR